MRLGPEARLRQLGREVAARGAEPSHEVRERGLARHETLPDPPPEPVPGIGRGEVGDVAQPGLAAGVEIAAFDGSLSHGGEPAGDLSRAWHVAGQEIDLADAAALDVEQDPGGEAEKQRRRDPGTRSRAAPARAAPP